MKIPIFSRIERNCRQAFTLIEIMVATVIMVILVGLVIQITSEVLNVWNRSSGKLAANAEARIAMDLLTQDLESAVLRNNGQQWLRVEGPVDVTGADIPYNNQTVALKLFAPALDREAGAGDICGIAYRLAYKEAYDQPGVANPLKVYAIYRAMATPSDTFNFLMGSAASGSGSPQATLSEGGTTPTFWNEDSIVDNDNYLVSNVVDFKVLIYTETSIETNEPDAVNVNDSSGVLDYDYVFGGAVDPSGEPVDGSSVDTDEFVANEAPLYGDIILTIVSDEGLELLQLINDPNYPGDKSAAAVDQIVLEHGEVFTRRVNFLSRPL